MGKVDHLHKAKSEADDEFYTLRSDVDAEMRHYEAHFKGKVVLCNCDDPLKSKFTEYFADNYDRLGLAGLLANHLAEDGTGDFRSPAAQAQLARADVVVTNPPFSIFRQYLAQLIDPNEGQPSLLAHIEPLRDKKFLVLGGFIAVGYGDVFSLVKAGRMWLGVENGSKQYLRPDGELQPVNTAWFTNIDHHKRHEFMPLTARFADLEYRQYENYDAVNVDRMKDIPCDYAGLMGLPLTFMQFYNPEQFELIHNLRNPIIDGESKFRRIIARNRKPV